VSNDGLSLTSQFVADSLLFANAHNKFQIENTWDQANAKAIGGRILSPLFPIAPFPGLMSHARLFIGTPELGPGTILGPIGPSSSITTASAGSSPNTTGPVKYVTEGHSSNTGAIAGGTVGGVVAISVIIVALFFYRQRRRSQARSAFSGDGQAGAYNPNLIQYQPVSSQETLTSTLPETHNPLLRPYVRCCAPNPLPPVPLVFSRVSSLFSTHRTRRTELYHRGTKHHRTRLSPLLNHHIPYRTPKIYTPLPARRTPKHRDMRAGYFLNSPFETIAAVGR
jgi:hypothetical protein